MFDRDFSRSASDLEKLKSFEFSDPPPPLHPPNDRGNRGGGRPDQPDQHKPALALAIALTTEDYRITMGVVGIALIGVFANIWSSGMPNHDSISATKSEVRASGSSAISDDFLCQHNAELPKLDFRKQDGITPLGIVVSATVLSDGSLDLAYRADSSGTCKVLRFTKNAYDSDNPPTRLDTVEIDKRDPHAWKLRKSGQTPLSALTRQSVRIS